MDRFATLPRSPGVYFLYGGFEQLLYIGKAKRLRDRIRSYRRLDLESAPENLAGLVPRIREVRWQLCGSEKAAFKREAELLHALKPPFNIAGTDPSAYFFIVMGVEGRDEGEPRVQFQLTDDPELDDRQSNQKIFGCYRHRWDVKRGYLALLRLIHACRHRSRRFYGYPARISRESPPYRYSTSFPREWLGELERFLDGRNLELLKLMSERLLESETLPRFLYTSIAEDLETARAFYESGPRASRRLKLRHQLRLPVLSHAMMDRLRSREVKPVEFAGRMGWE